MLEKAAEESWQPASGVEMNAQVGYYISTDGWLQWNPLRDEPAGPGGASSSSRSGLGLGLELGLGLGLVSLTPALTMSPS